MYELIQLSGNSYYIQSPAKIGLVRLNDTEVCLIDSGNDKDAGKKVRKILDANGWQLRMILNTHSNADHIGGNKFLQDQTGCKIYAPGIERDFTCNPLLEPSFLFGACPPKDLRHKFLMAQPSNAERLTAEILPDGFEIIPLPGHFFDMVGFRTGDDVVYLADCLSSRETIDKYKISFLYDVGAYLNTLETVKTMQAKLFVPSHAPAAEDISELAQYNIDAVHAVADQILHLCKIPICFEELLKQLFDAYGLQLSFEQYALVGSTVRSYLSWLRDNGQITVCIQDNRLLWQSC